MSIFKLLNKYRYSPRSVMCCGTLMGCEWLAGVPWKFGERIKPIGVWAPLSIIKKQTKKLVMCLDNFSNISVPRDKKYSLPWIMILQSTVSVVHSSPWLPKLTYHYFIFLLFSCLKTVSCFTQEYDMEAATLPTTETEPEYYQVGTVRFPVSIRVVSL